MNPQTSVMFWVDRQRLTQAQQDGLREKIAQAPGHITLADLRDIPAYDREPLYNWGERNPRWREDKDSLIWRQVDAAKVLVCLQGDAQQVFFADMDLAAFDTKDASLQQKIRDYGLFVNMSANYPTVENQMWGFDAQRRRGFFEELYKKTLKEAYKGENGWQSLVELVDQKLCGAQSSGGEGLFLDDFLHCTRESGIRAHHPGHRFQTGIEQADKSSLKSADAKLSGAFNSAKARVAHALNTCAQWPYRALYSLKK